MECVKDVIKCDSLQSNIDKSFIDKIERYKPFFADLVYYYISERYPAYKEKSANLLNAANAKEILHNTEEVFKWLSSLSRFKQ